MRLRIHVQSGWTIYTGHRPRLVLNSLADFFGGLQVDCLSVSFDFLEIYSLLPQSCCINISVSIKQSGFHRGIRYSRGCVNLRFDTD